MVVDSCLDSDGQPAALAYLRDIRVDPATAVRWVIATHWHDDHIRGLSKTLHACKSAKFCCSDALGRREFPATVAPYDERTNFVGGSGVSEIFEVLEELVSSRRGSPSRAAQDRRIERIDGSDLAHGVHCEIWTLSPSDSQYQKFLIEIGALVPELKQTKRRFPQQKTNLLSVVILIQIGSLGILLGADLEPQESPHFENGVISRLFGPHAGRKEGPKVPH
jgi:hypothetical protein